MMIAIAFILMLHASTSSGACKTAACTRAVAWKAGYTAIVLDADITRDRYFAVLAAVKANGGVVAVESEQVLLGWLPRSAAGRLHAIPGVRTTLYDAVAEPAGLVSHNDSLPALVFFNQVITGQYEDTVEIGLASPGQPLTGCGRVGPKFAAEEGALATGPRDTNDPAKRWDEIKEGPKLAPQRTGQSALRAAPNFAFQSPWQNPDMTGRVTVQLFRLDSDGSVDPNLYTWTNTDYGTAYTQAYGSFSFWVSQAAAYGRTLSFRLSNEDPFSRYTRSFVPTPTKYEPITHPGADDYRWVNDALALKGYGSTTVTWSNVLAQNEAFDRARAADPTYGPFDRSFSIYVVYNPTGAPTSFTDGQYAFAYYDGPFVQIPFNTGSWGSANLGRLITHEIGHIFWACDEYYYTQGSSIFWLHDMRELL